MGGSVKASKGAQITGSVAGPTGGAVAVARLSCPGGSSNRHGKKTGRAPTEVFITPPATKPKVPPSEPENPDSSGNTGLPAIPPAPW